MLEPQSQEVSPSEPVIHREAVAVDPTKPFRMSDQVAQDRLKLAADLTSLDTNVAYCLNAGIEWLETTEELIAHLCGGKFPEAGYMIYKNVRLCRPGTAEAIAKKERLTIEQIMFPKNGQMMVGKA